jgi:hypothetical protein
MASMRQTTDAAEQPGLHRKMHLQIFDFEQAHFLVASEFEFFFRSLNSQSQLASPNKMPTPKTNKGIITHSQKNEK